MVTLASFATRTLGDATIDNAMADLLFAVIVCWLDTIAKHEAEVVLRQVIFLKILRFASEVIHDREPRSETLCRLRGRRVANQLSEFSWRQRWRSWLVAATQNSAQKSAIRKC